MKFLKIAVLVSLFDVVHPATCPNDVSSETKCKSDRECERDQKCFRGVEGAPEEEGFCCGDLDKYCSATKMHTFRLLSNNIFSYKWDDSLKDTHYQDPATKVACPLPFSHSSIEFSKDLPVGFSTADKDQLKSCNKNSDCKKGDYCGEAANPSFDGGLDKSEEGGSARKFCYHKPTYLEKLNPASVSSGLPGCNSDNDCKSGEFCFILGSGMKLRTGVKYNGTCVTATDVCPLISSAANSNTSGSISGVNYCANFTSCSMTSDYSRDEFEADCLPIHSKLQDKKTCCIVPRKCIFGSILLPKKPCSNTTDCSENGELWCDNSIGACCNDEDPLLSKCPDGITPLFNEPRCKNAKIRVESSGNCTFDSNAICLRGHCCPSSKVKDGKVELGEKTYHSAAKCKIGETLDSLLAFCHSSHVAIIGKDALEEGAGQKCAKSSDCSSDESRMCVKVNATELKCVKNTLMEKSNKGSFAVIGLLIFGLTFVFVLVFIALVARCLVKKSKKSKTRKNTKETDGSS